jgi:D-threo-aldose 1-dehydrogenase
MRGVSLDRKDRRLDSRKITTRNGSDITFTSVGLGTGPLGELFGKLDEKTAIATVEAAYASGVRMFDSSPHYGNGLAEARLGAGLRGVPRDDIVVSTKIGRIMDPAAKSRSRCPGSWPSPAAIRTRPGSTIPTTAPCARSNTRCSGSAWTGSTSS